MISIATSATTTTLVISGDLDVAERDQFPEITARATGLRRQLVVIDMCRVTFMDSTGAGFLISLADSARRRGGAAVLRGPDPREVMVLRTCGALDLFRIDSAHRCAPDDLVGSALDAGLDLALDSPLDGDRALEVDHERP